MLKAKSEVEDYGFVVGNCQELYEARYAFVEIVSLGDRGVVGGILSQVPWYHN